MFICLRLVFVGCGSLLIFLFNKVLILVFCLFVNLKLFELKNLILLFCIGLWDVEIIIFVCVFSVFVK